MLKIQFDFENVNFCFENKNKILRIFSCAFPTQYGQFFGHETKKITKIAGKFNPEIYPENPGILFDRPEISGLQKSKKLASLV